MLLGVDVGGTFTDAVLLDADGAVHTAKVPSTPADQSQAVLEAVRLLLAGAGARAGEVERFAHGMTVATNALLEGRAARTALLATAGFTDVIELARQSRAHLYRLCAAAPEPLVPRELRFAVPERIAPEGVVRALEPAAAEALAQEVAAAAPQAVAVALLHSYADERHERLLGERLARALPDTHVSLSCETVGTFREYERTATTVLDAALSPLLAGYLRSLCADARELGLCEPHVMQSSGGLTEAARAGAHAALTVLSGPAGGVGGALALAALAGEPDVLCFDMGGTSCDVCAIVDSQVPETAERTVAGRPLALPALDIHTVGAGGGSIAWRDAGGALRVGPASAGADPGPACYGRGGTRPTVTDANLLLGRLPADSPLAGGLRLDRAAAEDAIARLARDLDLAPLACAEGIVRVAEAEMLGALRVMSVERGIDPRGFALMPFGGAGPLHAAAMARELGISRVLCPRACGVLCALGLATAAPRRDAARSVMLSGGSLSAERLERERGRLVAEAAAAIAGTPQRVRVRHELRYRGQSFELAVEEEPLARRGLEPDALRDAFARAHERRYGYRDEHAPIELVTMRASVWGAAPSLCLAPPAAAEPAVEEREVVFDGRALTTRVIHGELAPGTALRGPALCALAQSTLLVAPGWSGTVDEHGTIHLVCDGD
ncbi:MAG TPA: hydantoinase/oxoprolinase family protein [Solirubrobacteraceae bacterium]|jgi:N-methylhydantoinase A|nr:hydantoinase/oxoprolinase family protein [Solirubrobacteraceae bacterium]